MCHVRMTGKWEREEERRDQARIAFNAEVKRGRVWALGAWVDLPLTMTDLSSRGIGVLVAREVKHGDRLSLVFPLDDGPDMRVTLEIRHVRAEGHPPTRWRAGGQFRMLAPADHERIVRFIFAELRNRLSE
jgi:c-di-GMP-binding flagellar brake protein YcgR